MDTLSYKVISIILSLSTFFITSYTSVTGEEGCTDPNSEDYSSTAEIMMEVVLTKG